MEARNSRMLQHKVAEVDSAKHVRSFLVYIELVDDSTVLENLELELVARSCTPGRNRVRNRDAVRLRLRV
ncbi:hypothetical protein ACFX1S_014155 [Malus domestica]